MPRVKELWVFPVKSCQGTRVEQAELVKSGFELDRAWCVVDVNGDRYPALEYLSQRKVPCLATVGVQIKEGTLVITGKGMPELVVPIAEADYLENEDINVSCSGISTTDPEDGSWKLGDMPSKSAGKEAEAWFTEYLHREDTSKKSKPPARYVLARMLTSSTRRLAEYCGPDATFNGLPRSKMETFNVRSNDGASFQDFAPFLMTCQTSCDWLAEQMGTPDYPITPFRGSIVVEDCPPWDEEEWLVFKIGGVTFRKIKECPRCSIPCRDQTSGEFVFKNGAYKGVKGSSLQATRTLKEKFPVKAADDEWGKWKGPFMGVYVAHDDQKGTIEEGMEIEVLERKAKVNWCKVAAWCSIPAAAATYLLMKRK